MKDGMCFTGWPQFGDLLAWNFVNGPSVLFDPAGTVPGEAAYTNLTLATIGISCVIDDKFFPKVSYTKLEFDEDVAAWPGVTNMDDDFGDYYQASLKYQYSKALSFSVYYGMIAPGDAFVNRDDATEFYWEADLKF